MRKFKDFKDGDLYNATLLIDSSTLLTAKNGNTFAKVVFTSALFETIGAMQWGVNTLDGLEEGSVVDVVGKVNLYQGRKSIIINDLRANDTLTSKDFKPKDPITPEEGHKEFQALYESIKSNNIKKVLVEVIKKASGFFTSPAAKKNHHAHKAGLVYHSVTMAKLAAKTCEVYPTLNYDLMVAGALLHDAGKTIELSVNEGIIEYTTSGTLFGHIIILNDLLQEVIYENPHLKEDNEIAQLKHILLSHHGRTDWGSPVVGMTREAIILHQIDMIDAEMNMIESALSKTDSGEFSENIWALDNRAVLNPGEVKILDY